jgi:ATP-dependent DNA helicase RecG
VCPAEREHRALCNRHTARVRAAVVKGAVRRLPRAPGAGENADMTASLSPPLQPATRLQFLRGIGPARARDYERLGLASLADLVRHYPRTWLDARRFVRPGELKPGEMVTVVGTVKRAVALRTRGGRTDFTCTVGDDSGSVHAYFFGQPYLARTLRAGVKVVLSGEVDPLEGRMQNPMFEVLEGDLEDLLHVGRLVPVHPLTRGLYARGVRAAVRHALEIVDQIPDPLPAAVRADAGLMPLADALRQIHFPDDDQALARAREALAFEELFHLQAVLEVRRRVLAEEGRGLVTAGAGVLAARARDALPFALTDDQEQALGEIVADLRRPFPMHRLLIGDVGSGKTVVALLAALHAVEQGFQVAFMAPTEILARQHAVTLERFAAPAGVAVAVLTGTTAAGERRTLAARLAAGEPLLVTGTHALLEDKVPMPKLGLAIVDEQHRFGVRQRAMLAKKGMIPDVLVLSATPIPRTLALAFHGDLETSTLRSRPAGRGRLVTRVAGEEKFPHVLEFVAREVAAGRQAFFVVPLIEEAGRQDFKAAEAEHRRLASHPLLRDFTHGLLHGRLKADARHEAMDGFAAGTVQILTATTVVEVGIDVPNATVMVVENADRFGLSQLHQLRGRVGRGAHRSVCVLVPSALASVAGRARLDEMTHTDDGFALAEADLRLRGPGELWGMRQSGMPRLRLADLFRDAALLERARAAARTLVAGDPRLVRPEHATLRATLLEHYREPMELALAG